MTERPLTIRAARPDGTVVSRSDGRRPLSGRVLLAELDGMPLVIVAADGGSLAADPVARAEHAVRLLLLCQDVISQATRGASGTS